MAGAVLTTPPGPTSEERPQMQHEPIDRVSLAAAAERTGGAVRQLIEQARALSVQVPFNLVCSAQGLAAWVQLLDPTGARARRTPPAAESPSTLPTPLEVL